MVACLPTRRPIPTTEVDGGPMSQPEKRTRLVRTWMTARAPLPTRPM